MDLKQHLLTAETNAVQFLSTPGVDALHLLIGRTNEPPIALEATRVWVNSTRALGTASGKEHKAAWSTLGDGRVIDELVAMLTQGSRYPVLVNEAVLALTLLVTFGGAGEGVAARLVDESSSKKAQREHPNAGLEGKSGAAVLAEVITGGGAPETQVNAVTLVKMLNSPEVSAVVRRAVEVAKGDVAIGAREL